MTPPTLHVKANAAFLYCLLLLRSLQWSSAGIVLGIASYYVNKHGDGQHIIYEETIAAITVVAVFPGLLVAILHRISCYMLPIDVILSYLWLTAFIFEAEDYNWKHYNMEAMDPSLKYANESFTFLTFFFTICTGLLEAFLWWTERHAKYQAQEKEGSTMLFESTEGSG